MDSLVCFNSELCYFGISLVVEQDDICPLRCDNVHLNCSLSYDKVMAGHVEQPACGRRERVSRWLA